MNIIALRTYSTSCDPILEPIRRLGHDLTEIRFFDSVFGGTPHLLISEVVNEVNPELVVMLGQHDVGSGSVPSTEILASISSRVPFVHICCDGAERIWWPQLDEYESAAPEMIHINIDGVRDGFFSSDNPRRWTTLCPMDYFPWELSMRRAPWKKRTIPLGFCGGWGDGPHPRGPYIRELLHQDLITAIPRPFERYDDFRTTMCTFRGGFNHAHTGTGDRMHVKARVIETAFAGATLVEPEDSPTANWFIPGEDYLAYRDVQDIKIAHKSIAEGDSRVEEMAARMRQKAISLYSAERFWPRIFEMAGV